VSAAPNVQDQPAAAADGDDFLVVWSDWRNADRDIYGARVTGAGVVLDSAGIDICAAPGAQDCPAVQYDGMDFLVVWSDQRDGERDVYGARVTSQGSISDTFAVTTQQEEQFDPALARGAGNDMLLSYSGWTGIVEDEPYNSLRIWGTLSPVVATEERLTAAALAPRPAATIVRGVLSLQSAICSPQSKIALLDISGRKVLNLKAGANDLRALPAGIYFVRMTQAQAQAQAVHKVIVSR
jgi:hypothetical protein